jgi:hypothetical protein
MSDMKCPFCDSEIEQLNDQQRSLLHCSNIVCCKGGHYIGNISMWRDLIRTHKALSDTIKLAEEMLKDIEYEGLCSWQYEEKLNTIKSITKGGDNE